MTKEFFIIWNPRSHQPPCGRHDDFEAASKEARRLAERDIGQEFFVMRAVGLAVAERPKASFSEIPDPTKWLEGSSKAEAGPAERVPEHGVYEVGDRVRYIGRSNEYKNLNYVGRLATVIRLDRLPVIRFDGVGQLRQISVYFENIEHESLPQFEVGDRVRVKPCGIGNAYAAAGLEALVTAPLGVGYWHLRFDAPVPNDRSGHSSQEWAASREAIELVRPVQAGGAK